MATAIKRNYANFKGVDFANEPSLVNLSRSPDALNVWKDYNSTQGSCIETRPGYRKIAKYSNNINGIYMYKEKALVHAGNILYLWDNFPGEPDELKVLNDNMNNARSNFIIFNDKVYILDGKHYLCFDGETAKEANELDTYIPTTTINRYPSGGGEMYQDVNCLTPYRKNSFLSDGKSTEYYLDTTSIADVVKVTIDDVETTDFTVNKAVGMIKFTTPPKEPDQDGADNVVVTFKKNVEGYYNRIANCTIITVFDNRIFYSGNNDYPNAIFHCALNNPLYVEDLAYYEDGTSESAVKKMVVGNNVLWVLKENSQQKDTIFYHTATTDSTGKVYPNYQGNISLGCYADAINYKDDVVFLSRNGLEGISSTEITSRQLLNHRSSLVDNRLINENNFSLAQMAEWKGYLVILAGESLYLADMRQIFQGINGSEYEWYLWNIASAKPVIIKEYKDKLYIGSKDGSIFVFEGTNDNGEAINSYWTMPMDNFGYGNMTKTTNKRGGIAKIKTIPNGMVKVSEITNKDLNGKFIKEYSTTGFDFNNIDFSNFTFNTGVNSYIVYKIKEKKFTELSLKFYSDELDKPFGIYSAILEAFVGGYVKK